MRTLRHRTRQGVPLGTGVRFVLVVAALTVVLLLTVGGGSAWASAGWWNVSLGSRPTVLHGGSARNAVQEVKVTEGEFVLANLSEQEFQEEQKTGNFEHFHIFAASATGAEVQAGLEEIYGIGNVSVSGGPGNEAGSTYVVTFIGELGDQPVRLMNTELNPLIGVQPPAVSEITAGAFDGEIVLTASDLGDAGVDGGVSPVSLVVDGLPPGLRVVSLQGVAGTPIADSATRNRGPVTCVPSLLKCTFAGTLPPFDQLEVVVGVVVEEGATSGVSEGRVSGGGVLGATGKGPVQVGGAQAEFGIENYGLSFEEEVGARDTQAGSHPFQFTTTLSLNNTLESNSVFGLIPEPVQQPKDLSFKLPPGFVGNPTPFAQCTLAQFLAFEESTNKCPPQAAVGVVIAKYVEPVNLGLVTETVPIFNVEPGPGEPARFGFAVPVGLEGTESVPVFIDTAVRSGEDYGITASVSNINQIAGFLSSEVTIWGVPGDPRHDNARGWGCLKVARGEAGTCTPVEESSPPAFLSMPSSCMGPLQTSVVGDSWAHPGRVLAPVVPSTRVEGMDGCNRLRFTPSVTVTPNGTAASTPTGLTTDVHVPQAESLNARNLSEADVKDITVALPDGLELNPASADGLEACSEAQIGFRGVGSAGTDLFTAAEPSCPDASKIGNVKITTPLLRHPLVGSVYLASPQNSPGPPQQNPSESLVAMYVFVREPESGVIAKLPGSVALSATGQVTASFKNNPQVPFEDAELEFFGGDRAPLATPSTCGSYQASASFEPWSGGEPLNLSAASFEILSGPRGSACLNPLPFAPSLDAGTTNINAGAFSSLTTTISREDGNQSIQSVQLHMPAGLSGILAGVKLCPEPEANAGTCDQHSLIGRTTVSVGLGGNPFTVTGGEVFLTEGYQGAPFGLSIITPAVAGPFDLGKVVVRAKIEVDPHTAALTVTTGAIPHILDGIPLQIRHVNVTVDRPDFTFNPTNCSPAHLAGSISSLAGSTAAVSVPFQITNCATLKFTPRVTVTTAAKTSKASGSSLIFKIAYPKGAMGTQSWFNEAKFDLPKELPARLTTIQKACLASIFETNRAACPPASIIGHAVVHTEVLPVPLKGPVYFVSHGGAKFPDAVLVLEGYGVKVDLVGETFINGKTGVTSATFRDTPDVPFESIEVTVPSGPFSEFGANLPAKAKGSFCGQKLVMPTLFKAQNGLEIHQNTKVGVSGCARTKTLTRAQKLAAALRACKKEAKGKRAACQRQADRKYGPLKRKKN